MERRIIMATGLNQQLWASADILRGKMDASEYKNYLLGLIFYSTYLISSLEKFMNKKMEKQIPSQNVPLSMQDSWSGTKKTKTI